jgi:NhaA family Na+:H+ antiporter
MTRIQGPSVLADKLPAPRVDQLTRPFARFLAVESAGGVVLLVAAAVALALANSPAAAAWAAIWHQPVALEFGTWRLAGELGHLVVNDGLMTVFFFVVGLEIKRELVDGELRDPRKAALPVAAAVGGMVVPAVIYLTVMAGRPGERGWGIPMATDIAFVVGVMALFGPRLPPGLKVFLLSLAIADDVGAVIVIAAAYSTNLDWGMLGLTAGGLLLVYGMNRVGVRPISLYALAGLGIWLTAYKSGIHPTVAGVVLGLMTPTREWVGRGALRLALTDLLGQMQGDRDAEVASHDLQLLSFAAREAVSPLERLETALHPWVGFVIMPLFALANAGVKLDPGVVTDRVALAAAAGLVVGKPVGILLAGWLAVRVGLARLPDGVDWRLVLGAGALAGIGFTMSLFVAGLALGDEHLPAGKAGIFLGSVVSALLGIGLLIWAARPARTATA